MNLLALIILIITALVSAIDILFDLQSLGENIALFVKVSRALFFLTVLFFVLRIPAKKKN